MIVTAVPGSEPVCAAGTGVVLDVVRMAVNKQFFTLMPTLYRGSIGTDPRPYVSLGAMFRTCNDWAHSHTPAVNDENMFFCPFVHRDGGHRPCQGPIRRLCARPGPSAVPVAFVADGVEPKFHFHTRK